MKISRALYVLCMVAAFLIPLAVPQVSQADVTTLKVDPTDPSSFPTIQDAVNYANNQFVSATTATIGSYEILIKRGTYSGGITLGMGVSSIIGEETAQTIINGGGTIVTAPSISIPLRISNLTFTGGTTGILIQNATAEVDIMNNVFAVGASGTAVQVASSPTPPHIINNTFYQYNVAVSRDSDAVQIINNIFSNNTAAIYQGSVSTQNNISYNDFFQNGNDSVGPLGTNAIALSTLSLYNITSPDPRLVSPGQAPGLPNLVGDFHLEDGSPCIANGNPSQSSVMGAYGGQYADTIPFPVTIQNATFNAPDSITVDWTPNLSYLVTSSTGTQGSYNVYYSFGKSGPPYQYHGNVSSTLTSTVVSVPSTTVSVPPVPTDLTSSPLSGALNLTWTASPGATGYNVHYGIASTSENTVDAKNTTTFKLDGLTNGQNYQIAVSAYTLATYFISVTAVDNTGQTATPGVAHESDYSPEVQVPVGSSAESGLSNVITDFPEAVVAYPNLPRSGPACFIATAAYGYYSAPEVQVLRRFRDQVLLTNALGRSFVAWYYRTSPSAAAYLNAHPAYKPLVRAALLPAIGMSIVVTRMGVVIPSTACMLVLALAGFMMRRRKAASVRKADQ